LAGVGVPNVEVVGDRLYVGVAVGRVPTQC
jgi:hypothetical protein